jgi:hypothetical protein
VSPGVAIVVALRLALPLTIFRWPLGGGLLAVVIDTLDVVLIELIGLGGFGAHYQTLDKAQDLYYLGIEFIVASRWNNPWAKWPAMLLFPYRLLGAVLFEITHVRVLLFIFPNLFENWWLYCVIVARFAPRIEPRSWSSTITPLLLVLAPKMAQEYMLHYAEVQPWDWIKREILRGLWTR